jgi:tetratricopeptide (TPR) repeat protein
MADENTGQAPADGSTGTAPEVAWSTLGAASRTKADAFIDEQTRLAGKQAIIADLQIDTLQKKDEFELSHLRFRQFSDWARFALEIAAFLVVLLVICGLGTMLWNAAEDRDLVVDAISVPPDIAQSGMTGSVLAGRLLDSFGAMQASTVATTQAAASYRGGGGSEIRVEIPETGISLGDLNQYLRAWLGQETHVSGDLVRTGNGFALTLRYADAPGTTFSGNDIAKLVDESAEHLFAGLRPLLYGEYLAGRHRTDEALAVIVPLSRAGDARVRSLAYADWAVLLEQQGDYWGARQKALAGVRLDPDDPTAMGRLMGSESGLGHEEARWSDAVAGVPLWRGPDANEFDAAFVAGAPLAISGYRSEMEGDFAAAAADEAQAVAVNPRLSDLTSEATNLARDHDIAAAEQLLELLPVRSADGSLNDDPYELRYLLARERGDWKTARAELSIVQQIFRSHPRYTIYLKTRVLPRLAQATAANGDVAEAEKLIAQTPDDCDECLRDRAWVAAARHDWSEMARDFSLVAARSPHIPFAETDWGEILLRKGDCDGAIAKFAVANSKGPHFADPLEMWGEAQIAKNRSDLALAKFEEADKNAPNWGRLHLKWGEALFYMGKPEESKRQFAIAANLDLSPADKASFASWMKAHG